MKNGNIFEWKIKWLPYISNFNGGNGLEEIRFLHRRYWKRKKVSIYPKKFV
jgi:hypothetical protein